MRQTEVPELDGLPSRRRPRGPELSGILVEGSEARPGGGKGTNIFCMITYLHGHGRDPHPCLDRGCGSKLDWTKSVLSPSISTSASTC